MMVLLSCEVPAAVMCDYHRDKSTTHLIEIGALWTTTSEWKACQWRTGCKLIDFSEMKNMFASANTETLERTTVHGTLYLWMDYLHCACQTILKCGLKTQRQQAAF